jgi:glycosyltransferase involved in cell wall biosynthesis
MGRRLWRDIPVLGIAVREWGLWRNEWTRPRSRVARDRPGGAEMPPYPIDFVDMLAMPHGVLDADGVCFNIARPGSPAGYQPTTIAQYALGKWNVYLRSGEARDREAFLAQARWLLEHEVPLEDGAAGWPVATPLPALYLYRPYLSALTQGNVVSVMVRAYRLTGDPTYLGSARRAARTFDRDILDAGVASTVGKDGLFFEEYAVYPAAHVLNGFVLALFGLYDMVALTGEQHYQELIDRSLETLHTFVDEYDTGFWTRYELLNNSLASVFYHALHVSLFEVLAGISGCDHCAQLAKRWDLYLTRRTCHLRYLATSRASRYRHGVAARWRRRRYGTPWPIVPGEPLRVCVPIHAFPVLGGMRSVMLGVQAAMGGEWQIEYLTRSRGPDSDAFAIASFELARRPFGEETSSPFNFPNVVLYVVAGKRKLTSLLHRQRRYHLVLPQDGTFTAAFGARAAKHAGVRVVSMDHGNVARGKVYRQERIRGLKGRRWADRTIRRLRLAMYWPTVNYLRRRATHDTDMFLVSGDDVEAVYVRRLGVHPRRIVRYPYTIDSNQYRPFDAAERARYRTAAGIPLDAIVIGIVCRLSPEKGLDVALRGITEALDLLSPKLRGRVKVILAGSGPLRGQVEGDIQRLRLSDHTVLLGEIPHDAVADLLGISDIFLYASTRGGGSPVAVLEAMSAGCAVVATTQPESLAEQLAEGRGIAIPPHDVNAMAQALARLIDDPSLCEQMGRAARDMIVTKHSARALRRSILRATFFAPRLPEPSHADDSVVGAPQQELTLPMPNGRGFLGRSPRTGQE